MPRQTYFYYSTIKNTIAAFGTIFSDVVYVNDYGDEILVPLHYAPREKFIEFIQVKTDYDNALDTDTTLPRFGFELVSIDFDSTRMLNPMSKIHSTKYGTSEYMFNRIPYNFAFNLYLATRKLEDSLKIMEQVIPFFTPELNITVKDKEDFDISTDIPVILNNTSFTIDYQGSFETRRSIQWELSFTAKGFLYSNVREQKRIKETIVKMSNADFSKVYETLISEVEPRTAKKEEPHTIKDREDPHTVKDSIIDGPPPVRMTFDIASGELAESDSDSRDPYTVVHPRSFITGSTLNVVPMSGSL